MNIDQMFADLSEYSIDETNTEYGRVKIPMIIMQTWKTKTVPEHWKSSPESIKNLMPDWEHVLMTDDDNRKFIQEYFPQYLTTFDEFEYGIQRADFIRYAWLYINGGLYLDLDYELVEPLDELFYVDREIYVVPSGNFGDFYTNAIMASKPRAKVWLRCLELASQGYSWWHFGKHLKVMGSTGPLMFTEAINEVDYHKMHILNSKLLTPCSVCDKKPCQKVGGYMRTLEGSSWVAADTQIYIYCKCHWREFAILIGIIVMIIFLILLLRAFKDIEKRR
tara:strand:+ start:1222 stop:2055 length:834 start_codon:yes stop_codon:yes gene_type:complete